MSQNEHQRSVNDLCAGILDKLTGMERRLTTMNLSSAFIGKTASYDIASACNIWAPTVRQDSKRYTGINCIMLFLNGVLCGQLLQFVLVFNSTNMHAMSYWSDYCPCSSRVNIEEPAVCYNVSWFSAVFRFVLPSLPIFTAVSDT